MSEAVLQDLRHKRPRALRPTDSVSSPFSRRLSKEHSIRSSGDGLEMAFNRAEANKARPQARPRLS